MLRQNWVAFLTWLLIAEFAFFPSVNTPTMSCLKLPTVQRLAPKMSECVQLNLASECKAASTNHKRNVLISYLLGCARLDSAWRNPKYMPVSRCLPPPHSWGAPGGTPAPCICIVPFISGSRPFLQGQQTIITPGQPSISQQARLN